MIHFTCDSCNRPIDGENELRYVVRLEVYASLDQSDNELDSDRDHLQEIQDILEQMDGDEDEQLCDDVYHQTRFDLCSECRKKFVNNPLGRLTKHEFDFSKN